MANDKITLLKHFELLAMRCAAMVTSKIAELATSVTEALEEMDTVKQDKINSPADIGAASAASLNNHTGNTTVHVTANERSSWNAKSNFSGNYNDLTNKPTIPAAYSHPSTHPASMITGLATVATSGSYNDLSNKPTIPSVDGLVSLEEVRHEIGEHDGDSWAHEDIRLAINNASASAAEAKTIANEAKTAVDGKAPMYTYGTADLTAGSSSLASGTLYFVYE